MATTAEKGGTRCPAVAARAARILRSIVKRNLFQACHGGTRKILHAPQLCTNLVLGQVVWGDKGKHQASLPAYLHSKEPLLEMCLTVRLLCLLSGKDHVKFDKRIRGEEIHNRANVSMTPLGPELQPRDFTVPIGIDPVVMGPSIGRCRLHQDRKR